MQITIFNNIKEITLILLKNLDPSGPPPLN